jgi:hypothetical protein
LLTYSRNVTLFTNREVFFIYGAEAKPGPLLPRPFIGVLYQPWMIDGGDCGAIGGMDEWQEADVQVGRGMFFSFLFTQSFWLF